MPDADAIIVDGSLDFSEGVNSVKTTTVRSPQSPNGLSRSELAWLINGAVRDGGISPRGGWQHLCQVHDGSAFYQGGWMYAPIDGTDPYIVSSIGGRIYKMDIPDSLSGIGCGVEEISMTRFVASQAPAVNQFLRITNVSFVTLVPAPVIGAGTVVDSATSVGTVAQNFTIPAALVQGQLFLTTHPTLNVGDTFVWHVPFGGGTTDLTFRVDAVSPDAGTIPPPPVGPPVNPTDIEQAYFQQGEQFLVIQAGDNVTLPLFWDGATIRRSIGINDNALAPGIPGVNELPAATAMDYYMGRLFYAQGGRINAGDIVGGNSGTTAYSRRDSILNVSENPLVVGGDGFALPDHAGNIRALKHNSNQDSALGQGLLFAMTRTSVYSLQVPITRALWIAATNDNGPLLSVIQQVNGSVNDRSVVPVNGDLYYNSLEPAIRSILSAVRNFPQPGNRAISANETRLLQFADRGLLRFTSGIEFDNRLLISNLPKRYPNGVVSQAIVPMDFTPVSSFGVDRPPVWEGMYEGLDFLQLFTGNFGGVQRAIAMVRKQSDGSFHLWELNPSGGLRTDLNQTGENRISVSMEFPAFTWQQEFLMKKVVSFEFWIDRLFGTVDFTVEFRPDGDPCWHFWARFPMCSARTCNESVYHPCNYPGPALGESYRATITLPAPRAACASVMGRPANILYQCQVRLTMKGFARIRGILLKANPVERKLYSNNPI